MIDNKLIKSFVLIEDVGKSKKGDVVTLRRRQAMIPIDEMELYFENESNGHTFSKRWLVDNMWHKAKPHEMFSGLHEKFEHII
jgi:hypothetical protein